MCRFRIALAALAGLLLAAGCSGSQSGAIGRGAGGLHGTALDPLSLQSDLIAFSRGANAEISGTAARIAMESADPRTREYCLQWRLVAIPAFEVASLDMDPRRGYVSAYAVAMMLGNYFDGVDAQRSFGVEGATLARAAIDVLSERLYAMGLKYFGEELMSESEQELEAFAARHPRGALLLIAETSAFELAIAEDRDRDDGIGAIASIPMLPFKALGGIGDTPQEVHRIALAMNAFTNVVKSMPERMRWQSEAILLGLEHGETLTTLRDGTARLSASSERFAAEAERLSVILDAYPERLREESERLLETIDAHQEELRRTLDAADAALGKVNEALDQAAPMVERFAVAGEAWAGAAAGADATMRTIKAMGDAARERPASPDAKPFDIDDYTRLAVEARETVAELNRVLGSLEALDAGAVGHASRETIDHAAGRTDAIVAAAADRLLWRGLVLIGALGAVLLLLRLVPARRAA